VKGHTIQRILVAVDASEDSEAALEAAAGLAALVGAELFALYVEDENLLRLSKLRSARQVDPVSGADRTLEPGEVQSQVRAEAERLRAVVERLAGSLRIEWTFRTSRGRVIHELLAASAGADVVTVGLTGRSPGVRAGSTFLGIVRTGDRPVLVHNADILTDLDTPMEYGG
jgi:nucleotide-binding universal stress UspA family protein